MAGTSIRRRNMTLTVLVLLTLAIAGVVFALMHQRANTRSIEHECQAATAEFTAAAEPADAALADARATLKDATDAPRTEGFADSPEGKSHIANVDGRINRIIAIDSPTQCTSRAQADNLRADAAKMTQRIHELKADTALLRTAIEKHQMAMLCADAAKNEAEAFGEMHQAADAARAVHDRATSNEKYVDGFASSEAGKQAIDQLKAALDKVTTIAAADQCENAQHVENIEKNVAAATALAGEINEAKDKLGTALDKHIEQKKKEEAERKRKEEEDRKRREAEARRQAEAKRKEEERKAAAQPQPGGNAPAPAPAQPAQPQPSGQLPWSASGRTSVVGGSQNGSGLGPTLTYQVEVEDGLPIDAAGFANQVHSILNDQRGWRRNFNRVPGGGGLRVILASPALVDRLCAPLNTKGYTSCRRGNNVIINVHRWAYATQPFIRAGGSVSQYREYVINHEMGHALGHGHRQCPGPGQLAPVMQQQTLFVSPCKPNGWPNP